MGSARFEFRSANFIGRLTLFSIGRAIGHSRLRHLCVLLALVVLALGGSSLVRAQVAPVPTWTQQSPAMSPSARAGVTMAYDAAHNQVVLFGGQSSAGNLNDTWTWDGTNWTQQSPANIPPARVSAAMTYDAARRQVVLFGGQSSAGNLNDTWTWDGTNWTQQNPANSPPARDFAAMAYDAASGQVVLFGGLAVGDLNDTWTWDGTNWTRQNPAMTPSARNAAAMAYDAATSQLVLFGGISGNLLDDTWTWNGTNWTRQSPETSPTASGLGSLAYDAASGQVVLFDGIPNETWTWNGTNWTLQSPAASPSARFETAMAYDAASGQVLLFGGEITSSTPPFRRIGLNDTWTLNVGAAFIGSANLCLNGATTPSPCSQSATISFDVAANTTVGSINILTQGAANRDFKATSPDTSTTLCTPQTYASETVCTVDVTFAPRFPGQRLGGVVLKDGSGNVLANTYVFGTGVGPQVTFLPGTLSTVSSLGSNPPFGGSLGGVAVDGNGNVYASSQQPDPFSGKTVQEISSGVITTLGGGFDQPIGVAVDGSGNVYVADSSTPAVKEMPPGCLSSSCVATLGFGFDLASFPVGVAVDGSGNVYVADQGPSAVKELPAGCFSSSCVTTLGGGFNAPAGVAVDTTGNVFVADTSNNAVKEMPPGCFSSSCVTTLGGGFNLPEGVALDGSGNVYIADTGNKVLKEMPSGCASSSCVSTLQGGLPNGDIFADGVAVDGSGNVYVADPGGVHELNVTAPPTLSFGATNFGSQSSDSPQTVTLSNEGNAALSFAVPGAGTNPSISPNSFSLDGSVTCPQVSAGGSAGMLPAGASCGLPFDFIPAAIGAINGTAVLTDNNLNQSGAMQTINLSGTGKQISQTITFNSPGTGNEAQGGTVTASATGGGSGNAVKISSLTTLVCTVPGGMASSPATVSLIAPGTCTLAANQAGNAGYSAAPQVTQSFTVTPDFVLTVTPSTTTASRPGNQPVVLKLMPVNGFKGPVTLNCILPASVTGGTKCPGLPTSVTLNGISTVSFSSGVLFPNNTKAGTYVVTFTAIDGKFNDSTTAAFNFK